MKCLEGYPADCGAKSFLSITGREGVHLESTPEGNPAWSAAFTPLQRRTSAGQAVPEPSLGR